MSRMQDVGGCRSVLPSIRKVNDLVKVYDEKSRGLKHKLVNRKDYIQNPKPDGYTGILKRVCLLQDL